MKRHVLVVALVAGAFTVPAPAQTTKPAARKAKESAHATLLTRISPLDLLSDGAVRAELKLTAEQEAKKNECMGKVDRMNQDFQKAIEELGPAPNPQSLAVVRAQQRGARRQREQELDAAMLKALTAQQRTRIDQIGIQREGPLAFLRPEVQQRLNMDPGQIEAVKMIYMQAAEARRQARGIGREVMQSAIKGSTPGERPNSVQFDRQDSERVKRAMQKREKAQGQVRLSTVRQILKLLTKKQRQAYQSLCGEPFDPSSFKSSTVAPEAGQEQQ